MKYLDHKIKKTGHIAILEVSENGLLRTLIRPNQPIEKYKEEIESDPDFDKYRTQENADAYEARLRELEPSKEELKEQKKRQAEQKAREKALEQLIKKEMDESGISDELKKEKGKIDKE